MSGCPVRSTRSGIAEIKHPSLCVDHTHKVQKDVIVRVNFSVYAISLRSKNLKICTVQSAITLAIIPNFQQWLFTYETCIALSVNDTQCL